jgi:hypothetical protein
VVRTYNYCPNKRRKYTWRTEVPDFFDFYLGGLIGMKSYPFYAISGNEIAWLNLTYRFPLFKDIDARLGHFILIKYFFGVW